MHALPKTLADIDPYMQESLPGQAGFHFHFELKQLRLSKEKKKRILLKEYSRIESLPWHSVSMPKTQVKII